uniref:Uncharacterized protein n=1 Tax=Ditylenchus dipsaci TaxID=166011 RepID=A0A915ERS9_9BILA
MLKNADIYKHPRPSRTETLQFIANNMSQLEHLEVCIYNTRISHLELLYPLKHDNLEFATEMGLTAENVMQYLRVFTHLETFYCKIRYLNTTHHFFCKESADVLLKIDSNENFEGKARLKRVFRFQLEYYLGHIDNGI